MNVSASQCSSSSGCESGWTLYLDQSSLPKNQCYSFGGIVDEEYAGKGARVGDHEEEEEEEDLSMVSDASSGPRHYCEDDEDCFDESGCFCSPPSASASELAKKSSKKKKKTKECGHNQQHSYLDDTASSPVLGFSKKNISFSKKEASMEHVLDFSQGFSATHLKSSLAGKPASGETGGLQGRKWE
ncbi:hypothetical protein ACOSP7_010504 [Xanthoceras sorbifolium]